MSSQMRSFAVVVALVVLTSGRSRSDDAPAPVPAPVPVPAPTPGPTPVPTPPPTDRPPTAAEPAAKPDAKAAPGYIGLTPAPAAALSNEQRKQWNVKAEHGVVAVQVWKGGPADLAGVKSGDVLLTYAGKTIPSTKDLDAQDAERVAAFQVACRALSADVREGSIVEVVVERDGKPVTLRATAIGMDAMRKVIAAAAAAEAAGDKPRDEGAGKGDGEAKAPAKAPEKPVTPAQPASTGDK